MDDLGYLKEILYDFFWESWFLRILTISLVSCILFFVFIIFDAASLNNAEVTGTESFIVVDTPTENTVLLKDEEETIYRAKSERFYYYVVSNKLSEVELDTKVRRNELHYYFENIKVNFIDIKEIE